MKSGFLFLFSLVLIASGSLANAASSVSVMTYNLENLFDTKHDFGKSDYSYLPLSLKNQSQEVQDYCNSLKNPYYKKSCLELDWSNRVLKMKIANIAKVINEYNHGDGADIIVFQEVENIFVLKYLVKMGLPAKGYKYFSLIDGQDLRGIDVGVISKFPIVKQKAHKVDISEYSSRPTRSILEVEFDVNDKSVTIFANHWPSQGNVDEARVVASEVLRKAALKSGSDLVIATGDFNTVSSDKLNGIKKNILPVFEDVETKARRIRTVTAKGTHWHKGHWESLDKIFVLKSSRDLNNIRIDYSSFDIIQSDFMVKDFDWEDGNQNKDSAAKGVPIRFNPKTGKGYSDHLPVVIQFDL